MSIHRLMPSPHRHAAQQRQGLSESQDSRVAFGASRHGEPGKRRGATGARLGRQVDDDAQGTVRIEHATSTHGGAGVIQAERPRA